MSIQTNRALYRAVQSILERRREIAPPRERFLAALRTELAAYEDSDAVTTDALVLCLNEALTSPTASVDDGWRRLDLSVDSEEPATASTVDRVLRSQILDVQDARATGDASNDLRYFRAEIRRSTETSLSRGLTHRSPPSPRERWG